MKKRIQRLIAAVLATIMGLGVLSVAGFALTLDEEPEEPEVVYNAGDTIEYGTYPQTDVTNSLGSVLDSLGGTWKSYNYYSGTGKVDDGQMVPSNYMQYKDVTYGENKYRGVKFDSYRPDRTGGVSASNYQQSNGYSAGRIYWFRFDPIKWQIIDLDSGLIVCESVIDSQAYNNYLLSEGTDGHSNTAYWGDAEKTHYANNYAESSIRQWLNDDFCKTAFSGKENDNIEITNRENKCYATVNGWTGYGEYDAPSTEDKVFLISYAELNKIKNKELSSTAYAKCQGVYEFSGHSYWWLSTPYSVSPDACIINATGLVRNYSADFTNGGICPAMSLKELKPSTDGSEIEEPVHEHKYSERVTKAATCTEDGEKTYSCICGDGYTEVIPKLGHVFGDWEVKKAATCTDDGEETRTCSHDGCDETESRPIEKLGHSGDWVTVKQPTLTETGEKIRVCSVCGEELERQIIPKLDPIVRGVSVPGKITLRYKTEKQLIPTIKADPNTKYVVKYSSSAPKIVFVDSEGNMKGLRSSGRAIITVTVTDSCGNSVSDSCEVAIGLAFWQIFIRIFLFGWIWY